MQLYLSFPRTRKACPDFDKACLEVENKLNALEEKRLACEELKIRPVEIPALETNEANRAASMAASYYSESERSSKSARQTARRGLVTARNAACEALAGWLAVAPSSNVALGAMINSVSIAGRAIIDECLSKIAAIVGEAIPSMLPPSIESLIRSRNSAFLDTEIAVWNIQNEIASLNKTIETAVVLLSNLTMEAAKDE